MNKCVAFLRGINVSGHHTLPMARLKEEMISLGYQNPITILNSGNVIFEAEESSTTKIESQLASHLESVFQFPVPTIVKSISTIESLLGADPFDGIEVTKDTRLYISFLMTDPNPDLPIPWESEDGSYRILSSMENCILSVLDLSKSQTPKAMEILEKKYGKNITTRNWNTLLRIEKKLS